MVIFGTGVVTGGLLVHHAEKGRDHRPKPGGASVRPGQPLSPGLMRIEFLRRMERELDLAPAQREPIDQIIRDGQERMKKVMESVEPRRREEYKRTIEEFRKVLTPEQRQRLDRVVKQQQQRSRDQRKGPGARDRSPQLPLQGTNAPSTNS
jgi:hypothetical protein